MSKPIGGQSEGFFSIKLRQHKLTVSDLARALHLSRTSMYQYFVDPGRWRVDQIRIVSSMFGMSCIEMLYCLERMHIALKRKDVKKDIKRIEKNASTIFSECFRDNE